MSPRVFAGLREEDFLVKVAWVSLVASQSEFNTLGAERSSHWWKGAPQEAALSGMGLQGSCASSSATRRLSPQPGLGGSPAEGRLRPRNL